MAGQRRFTIQQVRNSDNYRAIKAILDEEQGTASFDEATRAPTSAWAERWCADAKARALAAIAYRDALNFVTAGISPRRSTRR